MSESCVTTDSSMIRKWIIEARYETQSSGKDRYIGDDCVVLAHNMRQASLEAAKLLNDKHRDHTLISAHYLRLPSMIDEETQFPDPPPVQLDDAPYWHPKPGGIKYLLTHTVISHTTPGVASSIPAPGSKAKFLGVFQVVVSVRWYYPLGLWLVEVAPNDYLNY